MRDADLGAGAGADLGAGAGGRASSGADAGATPRILMLAFACDPQRGSEPGAGAALATAAARLGDVTVVTRAESGRDPETDLPEACGIARAVAIPGRPWEARLPVHARYALWCVRAARWARDARQTQPVDVVHHAVYASDWFLNPLALMRKHAGERWVMGPGGGATYPSLATVRAATGRLGAGELVRRWSTRASRRLMVARLRARLDHTLALNPDSQRTLARLGLTGVTVSSNAVIDYAALPARPGRDAAAAAVARTRPRIVFMGRGTRWKGLPLLLRSAAHLPATARIDVAGPGTDAPEFREAAAGLAQEVVFHGSLPRTRAIALLAESDAMAFGSLHDSAPWAAAEAAALGVPVVCLDLGGVAMMAGAAAHVVSAADATTLPRRFAEALVEAAGETPAPTRAFTLEALSGALAEAYATEPSRRRV